MKAQAPKPRPVATFDADLAYLLSDSIAGPNIVRELERLKESTKTAAALVAAITAELDARPVWPSDRLGRAALALYLLDRPAVPIRRLHEHGVLTRRQIRHGH